MKQVLIYTTAYDEYKFIYTKKSDYKRIINWLFSR